LVGALSQQGFSQWGLSAYLSVLCRCLPLLCLRSMRSAGRSWSAAAVEAASSGLQAVWRLCALCHPHQRPHSR
jgi:hypothetical protein